MGRSCRIYEANYITADDEPRLRSFYTNWNELVTRLQRQPDNMWNTNEKIALTLEPSQVFPGSVCNITPQLFRDSLYSSVQQHNTLPPPPRVGLFARTFACTWNIRFNMGRNAARTAAAAALSLLLYGTKGAARCCLHCHNIFQQSLICVLYFLPGLHCCLPYHVRTCHGLHLRPQHKYARTFAQVLRRKAPKRSESSLRRGRRWSVSSVLTPVKTPRWSLSSARQGRPHHH